MKMLNYGNLHNFNSERAHEEDREAKLRVEQAQCKGEERQKNGSTSDDDDSSYEEEASNKAKRDKKKRDKSSYNAMPFNYNHMPIFTAYISVPVGKAPCFDGTNYN
jgi:hypothetical protein